MKPTEIYKINYDPSVDAVICIWNGYATSTQFRESTELLLETIVKNKTSRVLVDLKNMVLIGKDDQDWMDKTYIPKATALGMKIVACVQPIHYFNQIAVQSIVYSFNKTPVKVNYFQTYEDALNWLKSI